VSAARAYRVAHATSKQHQTSPSGVTFDLPRHPTHDGKALMPRWHAEELRPGGFPSISLSTLSSYKTVLLIAKKQGLVICLLS